MEDTGRSDQLKKARRLRRLAVVMCVVAAILLFLAAGEVAASARGDPTSATLVLQQLLNGQVKCVSNGSCTIINLYGPNGAQNPPPITPGDHNTTTVELRNAGSLAASRLVVSPGGCQNHTVGGGPGGDLCGALRVRVSCTGGGGTMSDGPLSLTSFGEKGTQTVTGSLAAGDSATCEFTVTYPTGEPLIVAAQAIQPITWTLTAATAPPPTTTPSAAPTTTAPAPTAPQSPSTPTPTPTTPTPLPRTGADTMRLALAAIALLTLGGTLFRVARRRENGGAT